MHGEFNEYAFRWIWIVNIWYLIHLNLKILNDLQWSGNFAKRNENKNKLSVFHPTPVLDPTKLIFSWLHDVIPNFHSEMIKSKWSKITKSEWKIKVRQCWNLTWKHLCWHFFSSNNNRILKREQIIGSLVIFVNISWCVCPNNKICDHH